MNKSIASNSVISHDAAVSRAPELLAPAGDWDCARAAIENGANAIYFGLDCGFNARFRAKNFGLEDLPSLMTTLRQRGVRGYVTMNTLAFPSELPSLIDVIESVARSGVDAVLVQDFGVARIVREICPELEIHASTQMSLTSAETIAVASRLGLSRVVLARELSVDEIRKIREKTEMPLEVFIHGALCVAYSGQCLTSESLGGRSANRGQCAQACRLPYQLVCDGEDKDLDDVRYLLSPQDLAGYAAIPDLIDAGVASLKIEGRLKTPEYVANITKHYRAAIDQAIREHRVDIDETAKREMELSFSRGFSPGWLQGNNHKRLVPGKHSSKRGIELGEIESVKRDRIRITAAASISLGDGLAIETTDDDAGQGGRVYSIESLGGEKLQSSTSDQTVWVGFGRNDIDWQHVEVSNLVFKNDDPQLNRRLRQSYSSADPQTRQPVDITAYAETGQPIRLTAQLDGHDPVEVSLGEPLAAANKRPADEATLREKVGRLGGTFFRLRNFSAVITGKPMVPLGNLNRARRALVNELEQQSTTPPNRTLNLADGRALLDPIKTEDVDTEAVASSNTPSLAVLCRTLAQIESAAVNGVSLLYADFHDIREYARAIEIARDHQTSIGIATVRMQKPGESGLIRVLGRHRPDLILARNLAAIDFFHQEGVPVVADFSLNVSNHRTAEWLRSCGAERVTASYDLNRDQLSDLVQSVPAPWLEIVIHQHVPMFHMEHCVFCAVMSPGTDKTNCGRPCDRHVVQLRDRVGALHTLQADVACRNTLYNQSAQSGAECVDELVQRGVGWYRLELLEEDAGQTKRTINIYQQLLLGQLSGQEVWQSLRATNRLGVTRGTLEAKRNPLEIL
tara:strand:- start:362230 stop:364791 length:2562 start_codon:yes stop_codon:yes gene_type:complete